MKPEDRYHRFVRCLRKGGRRLACLFFHCLPPYFSATKPPMFPSTSLLTAVAAILSLSALTLLSPVHAAEPVPLSDKAGRTIQAKIILVAGDEVEIETADGRRHTFPISRFSLTTQELINNYRGGSAGTPDSPPDALPTDFSDDPIFAFTGLDFKIKQLDHFRVHTLGTSNDPADKYAEKIYAEMVKTIPALPALFEKQGFRAPGKEPNSHDFPDPDKRFRHNIFLVEDSGHYQTMVSQYGATLPEQIKQNFINSSGTVGNFIDFDHRMTVIRKQAGHPAEQLLAHLLGFQLVAATTEQAKVPFWLRMGAGYFAEHRLFQKCTVHYLDFNNYYQSESGAAGGGDAKMTKAEILSNSESWIKPLKVLCKKEKRVNLERLFAVTTAELTPNDSGYAMALFSFMNSSPDKTTAFSSLLSMIKDGGTPNPQDMADVFGYATPEEFEAAWYAYVMSPSFR